MENMFFSLVIPVTRKFYLEKLLSAVKQQGDVDFSFEVLLVLADDIPLDLQSYDFTVQIIKADKQLSPAKARNLGADKAKGEFILFMDDDCIPDTEFLVCWYKYLKNTGDVIATGAVLPLETFSLAQRFCLYKGIVAVYDKDTFKGLLVSANCVLQRDVFFKLNGFREAFDFAGGEDTDLSLRAMACDYDIGFASDALVYHRHNSSMFFWLKKYYFYGKSMAMVCRLNPNYLDVFRVKDYSFMKMFSFFRIPVKIVGNIKSYDKSKHKLKDIFLFPFLSYFFNLVFRMGMFFSK